MSDISKLMDENERLVCSTGAKEVVMTDREPLALECALRSAAASGITNVAAFQDTSLSSNSIAQASSYCSNS